MAPASRSGIRPGPPSKCLDRGARSEPGLAERATKLICHGALTADAGIVRVQATVEPWNAASQCVLEKLGFQREGLLRSYTSYGGERRDVYLYSLLPSDLG